MAEGARTLEGYLSELRARLRSLPEAEVSEILEELRSHVRESAGPGDGSLPEILDRLGSPEELASLYVTDRLLVRASRPGSPWLLARGLFRWASVSVAGSVALLGLVIGYVVAGSFFVAALVKPFAPGRAGLWRLAGGEISLRLGLVASPPPAGEELLGFWIVPLGLLLGSAAAWLTARLARGAIRRFRPGSPVPSR
jgi:uncharacterized membrane protein